MLYADVILPTGGAIAGGQRHPDPPPIYDAEVYRRREIEAFQKECQIAALRIDLARMIRKAPPGKLDRLKNIQRLLRDGAARDLPISFLREARAAVERVEKLMDAPRDESRSLELGVIQTRAVGGERDRVVSFIASTDAIDRHNSRVLPMGIDTVRYEKNPVVLFGHDGYGGLTGPSAENIIGKAVRLRKTEKRLEADIEFVPASINRRAEMLYQMARGGFVNAVSIGFIPREIKNETVDGRSIPIITKSELLEISVVPIPSNPEALMTGPAA